jgi:hypothetical protein
MKEGGKFMNKKCGEGNNSKPPLGGLGVKRRGEN